MLRHLRVLRDNTRVETRAGQYTRGTRVTRAGQYTRGTRVTRAGQYTRGLTYWARRVDAAWGPRIAWKCSQGDSLLLLTFI